MFYGFHKIQQNTTHYLRNFLQAAPWKEFSIHNYAFASNKNAPDAKTSHMQALGGGGGSISRLASGDVGPGWTTSGTRL
jgi:hypothetical protein